MKKITFAIVLSVMLLGCYQESSTSIQSRKTENNAQNAISQIPVYQPQYFNERKTVDRWAREFDKVRMETYIYVVSYGNILGYYVCDGKPVSTESYLIPEEEYYMNGYGKQTMDIDGTFGKNQPGIRFFTATGVAVEWAGAGASWFFTTVPMPIDVRNLTPTQK